MNTRCLDCEVYNTWVDPRGGEHRCLDCEVYNTWVDPRGGEHRCLDCEVYNTWVDPRGGEHRRLEAPLLQHKNISMTDKSIVLETTACS